MLTVLKLSSALVANSKDALQNPDLIFENMARAKRTADLRKYTGPVGVIGDGTKVRQKTSFSNSFSGKEGGGHVLGTTFPLSECRVTEASDIDRIIKRAKDEKAIASQARAILVVVRFIH